MPRVICTSCVWSRLHLLERNWGKEKKLSAAEEKKKRRSEAVGAETATAWMFVGAAGCDLHPDRLCTVFSVQHVLSPFKLNTKDVTQCRPTTLQTFNNLRNVSLIWLECKNTVKLPVTPHFKRKRSKRISWMMIQPRREADTDGRKRSWNVSSDVKLLYSVWEERRSIIIRFKTETQNSLFSINSRN